MSKTVRVAFANIYQGLLYEGKLGRKDVFSKYWPSVYQDQYVALKPDIMCLAEAPLDDERGNSAFVDRFTQAMGATCCFASVAERSWLVEGAYYGSVIMSKYPLTDYAEFKLPNPHLEVVRPDGELWRLHDKNVQSATVQIGDRAARLFTLHYFPFHHFNRNMSEAEFMPSRQAFIDQLHLENGMPTLLMGDFNNNDDELEVAYPELFAGNVLNTAVRFGPEQLDAHYNGRHQMDHILYTPRDFTVVHSEIIRDPSDHRGIVADLQLNTYS